MGALLHFNKAKYYNSSTKIKRQNFRPIFIFKMLFICILGV